MAYATSSPSRQRPEPSQDRQADPDTDRKAGVTPGRQALGRFGADVNTSEYCCHFQQNQVVSGPELLRSSVSHFDPGCVKTL
jgi:hypothetical protein